MPKQQWEEEAKDRFIVTMRTLGRGDWTVIERDVVVDPVTGRNFDYRLISPERKHLALEIFRLVDNEEEIAEQRLWTRVANSIAAALRERGIKGYTIRTPRFNVHKNRIPEFISATANRIESEIKQNAEVNEFSVEGFQIAKIDDFPDISLFAIGPGGAVDPAGSAFTALEEKLPVKNEQVNVADHERVILIVNWAHLVSSSDMVEACTQLDFTKFSNIDQIYFEVSPGDTRLVYDRRIFGAFTELRQPPSELEPLFIEWLGNRLLQRDLAAFRFVQLIAEKQGSILWLPAASREQLVSYGEQFLKEGAWTDVAWVVKTLKDDPDPPTENAPDDPEGKFDDHARIRRGETVWLLHSVRGRLCWLLQRIIILAKTEYYEEILGIIEKYAFCENLYVRLQAAVPLIEMAKRRFAKLPGTDTRFMPDDLAGRIKAIALRMLEENRHHPILLEWTAHVLVGIRDLNEDQASAVFTCFQTVGSSDAYGDISWMAIFFSFVREKQFPELGAFKSDGFRRLLLENLRTGHARFRATAAEHLKIMLERGEIEFNMLMPFLESLASGQSDRAINFHLYRIAAIGASKYPGEICRLIGIAVEKEIERYLAEEREIWHVKSFSKALEQISKAGAGHAERVSQLRKVMVPHQSQILDLDV